jgi:hypothetical protein
MKSFAHSLWAAIISSEIDANYIVELQNDGPGLGGKEAAYFSLFPRYVILLHVRTVSPIKSPS